MKNLLVLILGIISFIEVSQAIMVIKKWNTYKNKGTIFKENFCTEKQTIIQIVEHNPINDLNLDSFLQVYGINEENIHSRPFRKHIRKRVELLIEPSKIVPETSKLKIKAEKTK